MVPTLSIVLIITNMLLGIIIPVGLVVFFRKRYQASVKSFFVGCAVMLLFALVLEQIVHMVVLGSAAGVAIQSRTWAYALYGALMAGVFEETGRFLAMRYVLKKEHKDAHNALMYGAGHGGFEMFVILSMGMVNNLIYALMINMGQTQTLLASLDDVSKNTLQAAFDTLIQTPSWQFALSPVERIAAITAQMVRCHGKEKPDVTLVFSNCVARVTGWCCRCDISKRYAADCSRGACMGDDGWYCVCCG